MCAIVNKKHIVFFIFTFLFFSRFFIGQREVCVLTVVLCGGLCTCGLRLTEANSSAVIQHPV